MDQIRQFLNTHTLNTIQPQNHYYVWTESWWTIKSLYKSVQAIYTSEFDGKQREKPVNFSIQLHSSWGGDNDDKNNDDDDKNSNHTIIWILSYYSLEDLKLVSKTLSSDAYER